MLNDVDNLNLDDNIKNINDRLKDNINDLQNDGNTQDKSNHEQYNKILNDINNISNYSNHNTKLNNNEDSKFDINDDNNFDINDDNNFETISNNVNNNNDINSNINNDNNDNVNICDINSLINEQDKNISNGHVSQENSVIPNDNLSEIL